MEKSEAQLNFNNVPEFTVSTLANQVKKTLETTYGHIKLRGEISGYRGPHSSGHCYFALKDDKARIDAVIWRGVFSKLKFKPEEGMEVVATGKVSSYPGSSKYQIVIESLEPAGVGALMALLEERKKKLASEGLFEESRKKLLPFLPKTIGIVTSPTGAVIRDMMHGFAERFPAHVIIWPVRVQGETCAEEVARAVRGFNALGKESVIRKPELLIVARGGGSLEDLWGFNEEVVARAVAESDIPVISAVGHETDWTIIDLVSDARAPTPTKAAEWAVPKYSELIERLSEIRIRLSQTIRRHLEEMRIHLTGLSRGLPKLQDLIGLPRQRFDMFSGRLRPALKTNVHAQRMQYIAIQGRFIPVLRKSLDQRKLIYQKISGRLTPANILYKLSKFSQTLDMIKHRSSRAITSLFTSCNSRLETNSKLLRSLGYHNVLERGFAIVRNNTGDMLKSITEVNPSEILDIEFFDGRVKTQVSDFKETSANKNNEKKAMTKKNKDKKSEQGSLF